MVTNTEEEIDYHWLRRVTDEYNPHVVQSDNPVADFKFKRPEWGLCATAYSRAFLVLNEEQTLTFQEPSMDGISDNELVSISQYSRPDTYVHATNYTPKQYERILGITPSGIADLRTDFPDLFEKPKYLTFVEEEDPGDTIEDIVNQINDSGDDPDQYVLYPINDHDGRTVGEAFFEYMAALHYISQGYIATNFGSRNVRGAADMYAWRLPELATKFGGRFPLEFLLAPDKTGISALDTELRSVAIEAEPTSTRTRSGGSSGIGQVKEQGYHRPYNAGMAVGPSDESRAEGGVGMMAFSSDGQKIVEQPEQYSTMNETAKRGFTEYMKYILLDSKYEQLQSEANSFTEYTETLLKMTLQDVLSE